MCGDSAGLITPLCGNGMSMAIHAAKLLCELLLSSAVLNKTEIGLSERTKLEKHYIQAWNKNFSSRLAWGRTLQSIFGNTAITGLSIRLIHAIPPLERWLISKTHGGPVLYDTD
jgi:flavin-dependent dehydrogenase